MTSSTGASRGGRVAFVTGTARGMGRTHTIRSTGAGAAIIAIDIDASTAAAAVVGDGTRAASAAQVAPDQGSAEV
ncbi:NAD(P)-dependent dehydrogenase (short-subunit alcohol dehydrogenase family) [Rhodococcus sp. 27YEA15]|uniref:hypothetical protein n=1 Tax=Rhodococcus sp. 27YEA15 TaxID=3156259 RepID=UPI003C7C7E12